MDFGKLLIVAGFGIAALGMLMKLGVGFGWFGRLPGISTLSGTVTLPLPGGHLHSRQCVADAADAPDEI